MRTTFKNIYKTEIQEVEKADVLEQFNRAQKASTATELKNKINEQVEEANARKRQNTTKIKVQEKIDELTAKYKLERPSE